jgi:hypothetical protein
LPSDSAPFVHEAEFHDALVQLAELHDALDQLAEVHEALDHEAELHEALDHEADDQEALFQLGSVEAAFIHPWASNTGSVPPAESGTRNCSSAALGFGGVVGPFSARYRLTSPTPTDPGAAAGSAAADSINAPLT